MSDMTNVEVTSLRKDRRGFKIGENDWYSCDANHINKGDKVSFDIAQGPINQYGFPEKLAINVRVEEKSRWAGGGKAYGGARKGDAGVTIGSAINNASLLIAHGKSEFKDLYKIAYRICAVAKKLKGDFDLIEPYPAPPKQQINPEAGQVQIQEARQSRQALTPADFEEDDDFLPF